MIILYRGGVIIIYILIFQILVFILGLRTKEETLPLQTRVILSISFVISSQVIYIFYNNSSYSNYVALSAVFSFIGDMILAGVINLKNNKLIWGMTSFAVTHILLITGYSITVGESGGNFNNLLWPMAILILVLIILWDKYIKKIKNRIMVKSGAIIYGIIISIMVSSSFNLIIECGTKYFLAFFGSVSFMISDSFIAIGDLGGVKIKDIGIKVWFTYFLAQIFIIYNFIL